jgi:uncharacterized repeat protein (TIGR01451 family)
MPDSMLRVKLTNSGFGSCIIGDSINSTCSSVVNTTYLDITTSQISNLQGIEAFVNLTYLNCGNNYFNTFPTLPINLTHLNCSFPFSSLMISNLPLNLETLDCADYSGDSVQIINLPSSLKNLNCSGVNLWCALPPYLEILFIGGVYDSTMCNPCQLPILPNSLKVLHCEFNNLGNFSSLPDSLLELDCADNQMTTLPQLPNPLIRLECYRNQMTTLPQLPNSLEVFNCGGNLITNLPPLSDSLRSLDCSENLITNLPTLPDSLRHLDCRNNLITNLPPLPDSLGYLDCGGNQLDSLPSLPPSLRYLNCLYNNLSSIPPLPLSLWYLNCGSNQLIALPAFNGNLNYLDCSNNPITTLPTLPNTLYRLFCIGTLISSLPPLPDSLVFLYVSYNPNLTCLPYLTTIYNLYFDSCSVTCLPNYGQVTNSSPLISSLPLCDIFNPNGCNFYWNISGKVFIDADSNCVQGANESGLNNIHVNLFDNGSLIQQAFTGGEGLYSFDVNNYGNYEVILDTTQIPFIPICPLTPNYLDTLNAIDSLIYGNDFGLKCKTDPDMGVWSIIAGRMIPGHRPIVKIHAGEISNQFGSNCSNGVSGTLTVTINGSAHYFATAAGSLTPSFISSDSINYVIPDLGNINSSSDFGIEIFVDTTAIAGSSICIHASLVPDLGDSDSTNNSLTNCFTIVSSFDPNDKAVYPIGIIDTTDKWLTYSIRFQNTGTAPADNIYILDTLDSNLDLSSFQLLSTSHSAYVQILDGGIAKFNFPNINLPDSNTNELLSHGYVQYRIKMKNNLSNGAIINNTAYIYFDFNPAVVTNTVTNTINLVNKITTAQNSNSINVWPVPFENNFYMETNADLHNSNYSIFNLVGFEIYSGKIVSQVQKINSETWSSGIYFLTIKTSFGTIVKKLIKN